MGVFAIYFSDDYSCFSVDFVNKIWSVRNFAYLCNPKTKVRGVLKNGVIAQLVEQRTENPCVPGSIPGDTTSEKESYRNVTLFFCAVLSPVSRLFSKFM